MSGLFDWISGKDPNKERRAADRAANYNNRDNVNYQNDVGRDNYKFNVESQEAQKTNEETNLRFQEDELMRQYQSKEDLRQFDFTQRNRQYDKSLSQKIGNDEFADIAFKIANKEQDVFRDEQLQSLLFNEKDSILDYMAKSSGLKDQRRQNTLDRSSKSAELRFTRSNSLTNASFADATAKSKFQSGQGKAELSRRGIRSNSKLKTQQAILDGMKAAGKARVSGGSGRSNAKAVQSIVAESGARQAAIANELMFAEQGINLDLSILKDQLIYDQTMIASARDKAKNSFSLSQATVDAQADLKSIKIDSDESLLKRKNELNQQKIAASRDSLAKRDSVVREKIERDLEQTLADNEANLMLKPEIYPAYNNPEEYLKQYDEEGNEIGWGLPRAVYPTIPEFREIPMPRDIKSSRVPTGWAAAPGIIAEGASIAAGVITGIGALPGVTLGAGAANVANVLGTIGNIGSTLSGQQSSFTPLTIGQNNQKQLDPLSSSQYDNFKSVLNQNFIYPYD